MQALIAQFEAVKAGKGPRLAVVLGDRGMGKTRLVQEFYRHLSGDVHDPQNYWPPRLGTSDVAPNLADGAVRCHYESFSLSERSPSYLWWGLRLPDPENRNAYRSDLAAHRMSLEPHLGFVMVARAWAEGRRNTQNAVGETVFELSKWGLELISGVDMAMKG